jgi:hypothetical protein
MAGGRLMRAVSTLCPEQSTRPHAFRPVSPIPARAMARGVIAGGNFHKCKRSVQQMLTRSIVNGVRPHHHHHLAARHISLMVWDAIATSAMELCHGIAPGRIISPSPFPAYSARQDYPRKRLPFGSKGPLARTNPLCGRPSTATLTSSPGFTEPALRKAMASDLPT